MTVYDSTNLRNSNARRGTMFATIPNLEGHNVSSTEENGTKGSFPNETYAGTQRRSLRNI
jgi:hypothetical protein